MTDERDPLDVLASADPARSHPSFDPSSSRGRAVLERAVEVGAGAGAVAMDGRRWTRAVVAAALALAMLAALAAAYVQRHRPTRTVDIGCYSATRGDKRTLVVQASKVDAVDACWTLWRQGAFAPTPTPDRLTACLLTSGSVGVFPGGAEACARLGRPLAAPPAASAQAVASLRDRLSKAADTDRCVEPQEARRLVDEAFADLDLDRDGWRWAVAPGADGKGYDSSRPCTGFSIDEAGRVVKFVPEPAR